MLPGDYDIIPSHPDVLKAYQQASFKPMGTAQDIVEIKDTISGATKHIWGPAADKTVPELRWVSPTEVITMTTDKSSGTSPPTRAYAVVRKQDDAWTCTGVYYDPNING